MADQPANDEVQVLQDQVAQLMSQLAQLQQQRNPLIEPERRIRESSVTTSAFGGTNFQPTGMAAWEAFREFDGERGANPQYRDKARARASDPGIFSGDKKEFDNWLRKLADKFEEDVETFRTEKSRQRYLMTRLADAAAPRAVLS